MALSTITDYVPIPANSLATTGLWDRRFQALQDNIESVNESAISAGGAATSYVTKIGSLGTAGDYITLQRLESHSTITSTTLSSVMTVLGVGAGTWGFKYTTAWHTSVVSMHYAVVHTGTVSFFVKNHRWIINTGVGRSTVDDASQDLSTADMSGMADRTANAERGSLIGTTADVPNMEVIDGIIVVSATGSLALRARMGSAGAGGFVQTWQDTMLELTKYT